VGKHAIKVLEFLPSERGTLLGFAKIQVKELRLVISGVAIHQKGESRWVQLPSKPMVTDGELIHEPGGRIKHAKVLEFEDKEVRQAFNNAVWDAYEAFRPP
jgi:hypothetical protein